MFFAATYSIARRARASLATTLLLAACAGPAVQEGIPELDLGPAIAAPDFPVVIAPALTPVSSAVINHGPRTAKRVALTFDGCSLNASSYYDERITKVLVALKVPATIFLGGKWMQDHPGQLRELAALPQFELASHGFLHPHMTKIPEERVREELRWTLETMYHLIGRQPTLFRAPYGEIDERLVSLAAAQGLRTVQFDLPSGDAAKKVGKKKLIEYVSSAAKPGSIVVMHINRRGWHTAEALPEIIARLRKRGFEFVTVSELMGLTPPAPPSTTASAAADVAGGADNK